MLERSTEAGLRASHGDLPDVHRCECPLLQLPAASQGAAQRRRAPAAARMQLLSMTIGDLGRARGAWAARGVQAEPQHAMAHDADCTPTPTAPTVCARRRRGRTGSKTPRWCCPSSWGQSPSPWAKRWAMRARPACPGQIACSGSGPEAKSFPETREHAEPRTAQQQQAGTQHHAATGPLATPPRARASAGHRLPVAPVDRLRARPQQRRPLLLRFKSECGAGQRYGRQRCRVAPAEPAYSSVHACRAVGACVHCCVPLAATPAGSVRPAPHV